MLKISRLFILGCMLTMASGYGNAQASESATEFMSKAGMPFDYGGQGRNAPSSATQNATFRECEMAGLCGVSEPPEYCLEGDRHARAAYIEGLRSFSAVSHGAGQNKRTMSELFAPNEILRVFKEYYPDVNLGDVEWVWEVPGKIYEASFDSGEVEYEVEITVTGHLLLSEISLNFEDIPEAVIVAVNENFEDNSIKEADLVQYSNGDVSYELTLRCASTDAEFEAHFRDDGMFLTKGHDL